jgi:type II secretory ATPase GspE/PulE/Tfp pilus assembly ATPase PilB-like protein
VLNRCAIAEILYCNQEIRAAFLATEDHRTWRLTADQYGFTPFAKHVQKAIAEGVVTRAEILRVFGLNEENQHAHLCL